MPKVGQIDPSYLEEFNTDPNTFSGSGRLDQPYDTPYGRWLTDPETMNMFQNQYGQLYNRYNQIASEGVLSQYDMDRLMGQYRRQMAPYISKMRGRASKDVGRRLGSRSGAAQRSISNLVDVPAMHAESDFASEMFQKNLMSRMAGLEGMTGLYGTLFGGERDLADLYTRIIMAQLSKPEKEGSFFGDLLDFGSRAVPFMNFGGGGSSSPTFD